MHDPQMSPDDVNDALFWVGRLLYGALAGIAGALPLGLFLLLIGGPDLAGNIFLFQAILIGTYVPVRAAIALQRGISDLFTRLSVPLAAPPLIAVSFISIMIFTPVMWLVTAPAFFLGVVAYAFAGQSLLAALVAGLIWQVYSLWRNVQPGQGVQFRYMNVGSFDFNAMQQQFATMDRDEEIEVIVQEREPASRIRDGEDNDAPPEVIRLDTPRDDERQNRP